jgi:hypothetical protein
VSEARVRAEGELRWVQASGSGKSWATAASPASGLLAYVTDFTWNSAVTDIQIFDRGALSHHKQTTEQVLTVNFTVQVAATGNLPVVASGSGASKMMAHLEFRMKRPEVAGGASAGSGAYYTFHGVPLSQLAFTEGDPNTLAYTLFALGMVGPTASGYLG